MKRGGGTWATGSLAYPQLNAHRVAQSVSYTRGWASFAQYMNLAFREEDNFKIVFNSFVPRAKVVHLLCAKKIFRQSHKLETSLRF